MPLVYGHLLAKCRVRGALVVDFPLGSWPIATVSLAGIFVAMGVVGICATNRGCALLALLVRAVARLPMLRLTIRPHCSPRRRLIFDATGFLDLLGGSQYFCVLFMVTVLMVFLGMYAFFNRCASPSTLCQRRARA